MNYLIQKTIDNRGYTMDFLRGINDPYHSDLKDIDKLCGRLKDIHDNHIPITVYPDFDTDGISAGTLGFAGFAELGFNVNLFVPDPKQGYGITVKSIKDLMMRFPDTKVIITCDTGIGAYEAADYCRDIGVEFLVTDHHTQERVSSASIIVNPMRIDETYEHPAICGAYVLYQVLQYYANAYCNYFAQDQIRRLRVFAGIGTVSDTMPVLYENRQLIRDAIYICRLVYGDGTVSAVATIPGCDIYRKSFWGLYQVLKVCEDYGVIKDINAIDESFFGFYLAPMFNSTKRMDGDMNKAFGAFFSNSLRDDADYLYDLNIKRKESVERELNALLDIDQPYAPYVYITNAKPGILGLLATKIMGQSGMPTFVMNYDQAGYHGSGRSPEWYEFPMEAREYMHMSGHEFAFGCGCNNTAELEAFVNILRRDIPEVIKRLDVEEDHPDFVIATDWSADTGIDIEMFNDYLNEIESYRPFGRGFPAPNIKFIFSNNDVLKWKQIGSAKQHLKISFANGFDALCWNQGHLISEKDKCNAHVLYGHLERTEYQGVTSVNFVGKF